MFGLRAPELLLIFLVLLLLFGATKLPALGSSLGSAIRNFKKGFGGEEGAGPTGGEGERKATLPPVSSSSASESTHSAAPQRKDA